MAIFLICLFNRYMYSGGVICNSKYGERESKLMASAVVEFCKVFSLQSCNCNSPEYVF